MLRRAWQKPPPIQQFEPHEQVVPTGIRHQGEGVAKHRELRRELRNHELAPSNNEPHDHQERGEHRQPARPAGHDAREAAHGCREHRGEREASYCDDEGGRDPPRDKHQCGQERQNGYHNHHVAHELGDRNGGWPSSPSGLRGGGCLTGDGFAWFALVQHGDLPHHYSSVWETASLGDRKGGASARSLRARFISSNPRLVLLSKLRANRGTSRPLNASLWTKRTRFSSNGWMDKECSPSNRPGTNSAPATAADGWVRH